jgi:hypothetical protein
MTKEQFDDIVKDQKSLKDLPNKTLMEQMDLLSTEYDKTKEIIINTTLYLDSLEELYNNIFKVYQERNNAK